MDTIYLPDKKKSHWSFDRDLQAQTLRRSRWELKKADRIKERVELAQGAALASKVCPALGSATEILRKALPATKSTVSAPTDSRYKEWAKRFAAELFS